MNGEPEISTIVVLKVGKLSWTGADSRRINGGTDMWHLSFALNHHHPAGFDARKFCEELLQLAFRLSIPGPLPFEGREAA